MVVLNYKEEVLTDEQALKYYGISGCYVTLYPYQLGNHASGWIVEGEVSEDCFEWVSDFTASHPVYGKVWGNFNKKVYADSQEGLDDFMKNVPPHAWDIYDI